MKRVIQIQLLPSADQATALLATMQRFNAACDWVAERAFERKLANRYTLHKLYYYEVRQQFDLPAQMACLTFAQVAAAYKRDKSKKVRYRFAHCHRCHMIATCSATKGLSVLTSRLWLAARTSLARWAATKPSSSATSSGMPSWCVGSMASGF